MTNKPSESELAYLSQLYNERRHLKLKRKDLEDAYLGPIQKEFGAKIVVARSQIDALIKTQEEHVRLEIRKLKTRFRMGIEWDIYQ